MISKPRRFDSLLPVLHTHTHVYDGKQRHRREVHRRSFAGERRQNSKQHDQRERRGSTNDGDFTGIRKIIRAHHDLSV